MHKLKKAAAVAAMVGGMGLVGGGVAQACEKDGDPYPGAVAIGNLQAVECGQAFESGDITLTPGAGDFEAETGNQCTVIGSVED
ncbi:hypothetical protein [Streptomyces bullii]|uniref:Secreted protein n=1 Tax=Streptomyces bullii TaxID=349910 RepID=A0ABW0UIA9_9ACTN